MPMTSLIAVNDCLIFNIVLTLILSLFCFSHAQPNNRAAPFNTPLEVKGYHDYSFDELQKCDDVVIDLRRESRLNGLIRSPDYKSFSSKDHDSFNLDQMPVETKCKWTIIAPDKQGLELKLVDFDISNQESECPYDKLEFRSGEQNQSLWIDVSEIDNTNRVFKYQNDTISSCDQFLQSFLTISSNSSRIEIDYQTTNSNLNILISFSVGEPAMAPLQKCETNFMSAYSHTSLIDMNLVCNCASFGQVEQPCRYLEDNFGAIINSATLNQCDYYSKLNKMCRTNSHSSRTDIEPSLDQICLQVTRTNELGWIASPSFHSKRYHNTAVNCTYRIVMQPYQSVQLRFKYFHLSAGSSMLIYDATPNEQNLIGNFTSDQNDFKANFYAKSVNSKTNFVLIKVSIREAPSPNEFTVFNFTYQIKGLCIENQKQCNSVHELNCYSSEQRCNGVWDCRNGEDERGCFGCAPDHFRCKNNIFCYKYENRCDGDHQCVDKSDELDCDSWSCNSANGTFLCQNGRCIYEQWVCDGANDCEDNSDELNCPSGLNSRRVITTAVLGATLCSLLLVMALGCACKLYALHTAAYRGSFRFSHAPGQSAALVSGRRRRRQRHHQQSNLSSFVRRLRAEETPAAESAVAPHHSLAPPTYNQTMGLVDEYEQRQLAFIEHVRSILSQQQHQQQAVSVSAPGAQLTSMTIVPTSASVCRTNVRRAHRHRHHRGTEESRHRRRHRAAASTTSSCAQVSFDLNRVGLAQAVQQCDVAETDRGADAQQTQTPLPKNSNAANSANLRDKIAKLIKDIVVHHGDSINYVQLAESTAGSTSSQNAEQNNQPNTSQNSSNSSEDDVPLIQP